MRVDIHEAGDAPATVLRDLPEDARIRDVIELTEEESFYLVGSDETVDTDLTVRQVFGSSGGQGIKHPCKKVDVTVIYNGVPARFEVTPSQHVKQVLQKAVKELGIDHGQIPDLALRRAGTETDLPVSDPIGAYTAANTCGLELDLVYITRSQG